MLFDFNESKGSKFQTCFKDISIALQGNFGKAILHLLYFLHRIIYLFIYLFYFILFYFLHVLCSAQKKIERIVYVKNVMFLRHIRPEADDVLVLRQELVHAQTLMDQMTQEREKRQEQLEKTYKELQNKYEQ